MYLRYSTVDGVLVRFKPRVETYLLFIKDHHFVSFKTTSCVLYNAIFGNWYVYPATETHIACIIGM